MQKVQVSTQMSLLELRFPRTVSHFTNKNARLLAGSLLQALVLLAIFGRRDWTRTNDPHHVKVVL